MFWEELSSPVGYEAGWAPVPVWMLQRRENSLHGLEPQFLGYIFCSLVTILTITAPHRMMMHMQVIVIYRSCSGAVYISYMTKTKPS
jgi:hypothetical protein